jgi:malate/lactate dehydrogenase
MRIAIIGGAGRVGSQIAYTLATSTLPIDVLQLYDIVPSINGEMLDLQHAMKALGKRLRVKSASLQDCRGADIVIFVAGLPLSKAGTLDRNALAKENARILRDTLDELVEPDTVYIIVTNPSDVMTYLAAKLVGDRHHVLGISTLTDTARMDGPGYLIGEHGGHMLVIGGEQSDAEKAKQAGLDVVKAKGGTWFAVASLVRRVVSAIVNNEKAALPISCSLRGEFGLSDVALSVPCVIGKEGIERIETINLTKEQRTVLDRAAQSVRAVLSTI